MGLLNVKNLNVSVNYVRSWGKWQAVREFFQNLYDACLEQLPDKNPNNLRTEEERLEEPGYRFVFYNKIQLNELARIEYYSEKQLLKVKNGLGNMVMSTK